MTTRTIDLRSDTVTRPTQPMREVMAAAEVGDDVLGEDPTVNRLEAQMAETMGKEAAVFVPSGTQSNLLALLSHCERGDECIVGQRSHNYQLEGGGGAIVGSIQPQPLEMEADGSLDLEKVVGAIKPDDDHFVRTRLLCLENTHDGKVLPLAYLEKARDFTKEHALGLHLDGARVFNAAVMLGVPVSAIARHADTVSSCLSKGLGAPVGSVLSGPRALIARARRWRKVLGGGMRQAGILAAAGIYALENNVARLAKDHANARRLAQGLARIDGLGVDPDQVQTNMVFISMEPRGADALEEYMRQKGVLISGRGGFRLVTHLDVNADDIDRVVALFESYLSKPALSSPGG